MSREFSSIGSAVKNGLFGAGRWDLYKEGGKSSARELSLEEIVKHPDVTVLEGGGISQMGNEMESCFSISVVNSNGIKVTITATKFRGGYDCWVGGESGFTMRL